MNVQKRTIRGRVYTVRQMPAEAAADVFLRITDAVGAEVLALATEVFEGDAKAVAGALLANPKALGAIAARVARGIRPHFGTLAPILFEGVHCDRCRLGTVTGAEGPADLGGEHERWRDHFAGPEGLRDLPLVIGWVLAANFLTPSEVASLFSAPTPSAKTGPEAGANV